MRSTAPLCRASLRRPAAVLIGSLLLVLTPPAALAAAPAAAVAAAAPASGAAADLPLYQVEMVVFRATLVGDQEDWSSVPPGRGFGAPLGSGAQTAQMVHTLAASDFRLDGIVRGLARSGAWRPVAHVAWVQTAPPWGSHTGVPLSQLGVDAPGLTGTVYLEHSQHYLQLGFDVTLNAGAPYRIDEMRNIRPNEKQYFDHPAFGIIAAVYPLKRTAR
ncbi:MAG TPA: CsiV family protein [Steroidobacteraceae bacterium]|jgi:hypothetical protein